MAETFLVEDGNQVAGANAYVTISFADDYLDRYKTSATTPTWFTLDTTNKQRLIMRATSLIDGIYRNILKGSRSSYEQTLEWPRANVYDGNVLVDWDEIPLRWKQAVCEYCKRLADGEDIRPDIDRGNAIQSEKIGPIQTVYFVGAPVNTVHQVVDILVRGFIYNSSKLLRG